MSTVRVVFDEQKGADRFRHIRMRQTLRALSSVALVVTAGCAGQTPEHVGSGDPASSPLESKSAASAPPVSTKAPSMETDQSVPEPPAQLEVGSIAEVTVNGLRVRSEPGIDAGEAAPGSTGTLDSGNRVYLASGPVTASGFDWYFISEDPPVFWQPVGCPTPPGDCGFPALGWVAAGPSDEPWLNSVDPGCPQPPYEFLEIHALGPLERLSCLAGETITITGRVAVGGNGWDMPIFEAEPSWLGSLVSPVLFGGGSGAQAVMPVRYAPELGDCLPGAIGPTCQLIEFEDQMVEVDLVIDHPASATCHPVHATTPVEVAVLRCSAQLVVTAVRAVGAP